MRSVLSDLAFALRSLARRRGFLAAVVLTLALGLGANTAMFSLVDAVLLHPLPAIARPSEVVAVYHTENAKIAPMGLTYPAFRAIAPRARTLSGLAGDYTIDAAARIHDRVQRVSTGCVSGNYFSVLGIRPEAGRLLAPADDDAPGAHAVVVLSDALWQSAFDHEPSAVGSTIEMGGHPFTIIGVAPPGFHGTDLVSAPDIWVPLTMITSLGTGELFSANMNMLVFQARAFPWVHAVGRLRPSITVAAATAELSTLIANDARASGARRITIDGRPLAIRAEGASLVPIAEAATMSDHRTLVRFVALLLGVVGLTLLIACVNVANLMLVRSTERARELGVRAALGASRARLTRQLFLESLLLAAFGAAAGVVVGVVTMHVLRAFTLPGRVQLDRVTLTLDWRVLAFTIALAAATAVLFGLLPAIRASRADLASLFKAAGTAARRGPRGVLVAGQVAMSLVLLVGAALFVRSLRAGLTTDLGFDPRPLAAVTMDTQLRAFDNAHTQQYYDEVMARARRIPGVRGVAVGTQVPLARALGFGFKGVAGARTQADTAVSAEQISISPDYFAVLGVPLVSGRPFTSADNDKAPQVAIVNESAARIFSPDGSILGREITMSMLRRQPYTVVGVVRDTKYESLSDDHKPAVFVPIAQQNPQGIANIVVRSADPRSTLPLLRRAVASVDPNVPLRDARLVADQIDTVLMPQRFGATLLGLFALVSLCVSAVGIYGVVAYAVSQRAGELAVRVALGAQGGDIVRLVLRHTGIAVLVGSAVGIAGAVVASRALAQFLYGVTPLDAAAFVGATVLLGLAAAVASSIPAMRAARVDPIAALRSE